MAVAPLPAPAPWHQRLMRARGFQVIAAIVMLLALLALVRNEGWTSLLVLVAAGLIVLLLWRVRPLGLLVWLAVAFLALFIVGGLLTYTPVNPLSWTRATSSGSSPRSNSLLPVTGPSAGPAVARTPQAFVTENVDGSHLGGVDLRIVDTRSVLYTATTNSSGEATVSLPQDKYLVYASKEGYDSFSIPEAAALPQGGWYVIKLPKSGSSSLHGQSPAQARVLLNGVHNPDEAIQVAVATGSAGGGIDSRDDVARVDCNAKVPPGGLVYFRDGTSIATRPVDPSDVGHPACEIILKSGADPVWVWKECGNISATKIPRNSPPSVPVPTATPTPVPRPTPVPTPSPSKDPGGSPPSVVQPSASPTPLPPSTPPPGNGGQVANLSAGCSGTVQPGGVVNCWASWDAPGANSGNVYCGGTNFWAAQSSLGHFVVPGDNAHPFQLNHGLTYSCRAYARDGSGKAMSSVVFYLSP